jgi:hypothetical protein
VTSNLAALAVANLVMLALGCGLLPLLRIARTRRELIEQLPLAYAVGLAATGVLAAELAVFGVAVGPLVLSLVAIIALAAGLPGLPAGERWRPHRPRRSGLPALALLAVTSVYVIAGLRLAAVSALGPGGLSSWDTRARALYGFGRPTAPVFTDLSYGGLQQPLGLPALEAVGFRFAGGFDGTLLDLQLLAFGVALVGGAWTLLRRSTNPLLLAGTLLAIVTAPAFFDRLLSGSADIPLAVFLALGVTSLALWLRSGQSGLLTAATLFLGAAAITQTEGECFVLAGFVAAALVSRRAQRRPLAIAAAVVLALVLPWRAWLWVHRLPVEPFGISHLFHPSFLGPESGRLAPAASELWHELWRPSSWSLVPLLVLAGLAAGCVFGRRRVGLFGVGWVLLSFAGLLGILWIAAPGAELGLAASTAGLLVGGALLVPLALSTAPEPAPTVVPARGPHPLVRLLAPVRAAIPLPHRTPESGTAGESAPAHGLPWGRPRRELLLLALVAAATLSPVYAIDAQDVSRLCLTQALVHFRLSSDYCLSDIYARDKSVYHGHLYSDKAPGMSVLELPAAEAVRLPSPYHWPYEGLRLWAVRVLASGLALIIGALLVGRISEGIAPGYGGAALVTYALGTLVAPLAAANFEHVTAGTVALGAFALAWRRKPLAAGLAAGAAVDFAYETGLIVLILAAYVIYELGRRGIARFALGLVPGAVLLGAYDWLAFGAPWHLSYSYKSAEFSAAQSSGLFGIHLPYLHAIHAVLVGRGGLLMISPVLVAAAYGLFLLRRRFPAEAAVCAGVALTFMFLEWGYFDPYGGLSPGPRFFVPAIPFLALGLASAFAARFWLTTALAALSIAPITGLTLTWANGPPGHGSIWGILKALRFEGSSSQLVQGASSNVLHWLGAGKLTSGLFVGAAAALALLAALPFTFARNR